MAAWSDSPVVAAIGRARDAQDACDDRPGTQLSVFLRLSPVQPDGSSSPGRSAAPPQASGAAPAVNEERPPAIDPQDRPAEHTPCGKRAGFYSGRCNRERGHRGACRS